MKSYWKNHLHSNNDTKTNNNNNTSSSINKKSNKKKKQSLSSFPNNNTSNNNNTSSGLTNIWKLWRHCCCRYGTYPLLVAPLILSACLLDLYSTLDCHFLEVHIGFTPANDAWNTSQNLESGFFFFYNDVDGGATATTTASGDDVRSNVETLLDNTDRYRDFFGMDQCQAFSSSFEARFIEGDRTWEVARIMAMISGIAGMLATVTSWCIVITPLPVCFFWPGVLLPAIVVSFLAEGSKFLFFDSAMCHSNLWIPSGEESQPLAAESCTLGRSSYVSIASCGTFFICLLLVCLHSPKKRDLKENYGQQVYAGEPLGSYDEGEEYGGRGSLDDNDEEEGRGGAFPGNSKQQLRQQYLRNQLESPTSASVYLEEGPSAVAAAFLAGGISTTKTLSNSTSNDDLAASSRTQEFDAFEQQQQGEPVVLLAAAPTTTTTKTTDAFEEKRKRMRQQWPGGKSASSDNELSQVSFPSMSTTSCATGTTTANNNNNTATTTTTTFDKDFRDDHSGIISRPGSVVSSEDDMPITSTTKKTKPTVVSKLPPAYKDSNNNKVATGNNNNTKQDLKQAPTAPSSSEDCDDEQEDAHRLSKMELMRQMEERPSDNDELIENCMKDLTKSFLSDQVGSGDDDDDHHNVFLDTGDDHPPLEA